MSSRNWAVIVVAILAGAYYGYTKLKGKQP